MRTAGLPLEGIDQKPEGRTPAVAKASRCSDPRAPDAGPPSQLRPGRKGPQNRLTRRAAPMDQPEPKKRRLEGMSVEDRLRRSRERNREHARRTRQRKKAQLQTLQSRVAELQEEGRRLEEAFKDCSTANILLGLNNPAMARTVSDLFKSREDASLREAMGDNASDGEGSPRVRPVSPSSSKSSLDDPDLERSASALTQISADDEPVAKPTIHWKSGYALDSRGARKDLSPAELDKMRRERNRLHAKMTRDRKKVYIETLTRAVTDLEDENRAVRRALALQLDATVGEPGRYLSYVGLGDETVPC